MIIYMYRRDIIYITIMIVYVYTRDIIYIIIIVNVYTRDRKYKLHSA